MECDQPTDIESVDENQTNNDFESNGNMMFALEPSHDNFDDNEVNDKDDNEKEEIDDHHDESEEVYYDDEDDDHSNNNLINENGGNEEHTSQSDDTILVNESSTSSNSDGENIIFSESINNDLNEYLRMNLFSNETVSERVNHLAKYHV